MRLIPRLILKYNGGINLVFRKIQVNIIIENNNVAPLGLIQGDFDKVVEKLEMPEFTG